MYSNIKGPRDARLDETLIDLLIRMDTLYLELFDLFDLLYLLDVLSYWFMDLVNYVCNYVVNELIK